MARRTRPGPATPTPSPASPHIRSASPSTFSHRNDIHFQGLSTRPMSELVRMRESPVYKWLLLRGEEFGWYPYQNEPLHWEFNPPGFREIFWAEFPGGASERAIIIDEP